MAADETITQQRESTDPVAPVVALLPADFARYQLLGELARGGHGRILRARDTRLDRPVALKVPLHPDGGRASRARHG